MRRKVSLVVALLVLVVVAVQPVLAITWGEPDYVHENVGAIIVDLPGWGWVPWCSGTLVHQRVFLTAGHCTAGLDSMGYGPEDVWVSFDRVPPGLYDGDGDPPPDTSWVGVVEMITHPEFRSRWNNNPDDVGVLILAEPGTDITPANLPYVGFLDELREAGKLRPGPNGSKFTVVGYGATLDWPPPHFYYEDKRQYAESEYRALVKNWLRMSMNHATGDGGICYGDSGGPAFWTDPDTGEETLVGINSWADYVCVASFSDYRVDIPDTLDFIADVIDGLE